MGLNSVSGLTLLVALVVPCTFALPPSPHSEMARRQTSASDPNTALPGWNFVGCFTDDHPAARTLQEFQLNDPNMTPLDCTEFCDRLNSNGPLVFAGTEFANECYCDFNIQGTATQVDDSLCNMPCAGDNTLTCGGPNLISIFQNSAAKVPTNIETFAGWNFITCLKDAVDGNPRTLAERLSIPNGATIEGCTNFCDLAGFNISGLEFGRECWCGSSFSLPFDIISAPDSDCSRACEAKPTELCGAANRLSIYVTGNNPIVFPSLTTTDGKPIFTSPTPTVASPTVILLTTAAPPTTTSLGE